MKLLVLGLGYSARAFVAAHGARFSQIVATSREPQAAPAGVTLLRFDGAAASPALREAARAAQAVLVSIPPDAAGCPALRCLRTSLAQAEGLRRIVYLSTVGVYGDHGGAWVDEGSPCRPSGARGLARLQAEAAWRDFAFNTSAASTCLRLAGIYGPGRSPLAKLRAGTARRIDKPGQVFNRIHVADIAGLLGALFAAEAPPPILNGADDEPAPPQEVVAHGAALLGLPPPPLEAFDSAAMTPMARSFYGENKRVSNRLAKDALGYRFRYPTYREGLGALAEEGA